MLSEWKVKFLTIDDDPTGVQVGDLQISGEACVDFPDQAGAFCRSMRNLDRAAAQIDVDLDIPRATAKFKIHIPVVKPPGPGHTVGTDWATASENQAPAQVEKEKQHIGAKPKGGHR